MLYNYMLCI